MAQAFAIDRRTLFAAAALPALVTAAPIAQAMTPFRLAQMRHDAALARFHNLPSGFEARDPAAFEVEMDRFLDASRAFDMAPIADWREFCTAFIHAVDGGDSVPNQEHVEKLVADARRLLAEGR